MTQRSAIRRGDIHLVGYSFPHEQDDDQTGALVAKERPVLILQTDLDNTNEYYPLVLAAPITTQKTDRIYEQDVLLPAGEANLREDSKVLLGLIQPFLKKRLGRQLGHVSADRMRLVDLKLLRLLGFALRQM
jgi:mRNA-degrading endonuclease toxin of MazEF toxin-antitoxin module